MSSLKTLLAVLALSCCVASVHATYGFDLSYFQGDVSQSSYDCLADSGFEFAVIQATAGTGGYNPYVADDVSRALAAGVRNVDVYIFPDTDLDPSSSMEDIMNQLLADGVMTDNMVWMDIEGTQYWSSSCDDNVNWLAEAVETIEGMYNGCGLSTCVGIYSSSSQWDPIMCDSDYFGSRGYSLWYAHYDNNPSFSDFSPFGGWSEPSIKQYQGTTSMCSTDVDLDWY